MRRDVNDEQAASIVMAMRAQRAEIVSALDALAVRLGFVQTPNEKLSANAPAPDVLRARRIEGRTFLFVGIARGFDEPAGDEEHQRVVRAWLRRFARLVGRRVAGGYVAVGAYDEGSAHAWATLCTKLARAHRLQRGGATARFVVRDLGPFSIAL